MYLSLQGCINCNSFISVSSRREGNLLKQRLMTSRSHDRWYVFTYIFSHHVIELMYPQIHISPRISLPLSLSVFVNMRPVIERHTEQWRSPVSSHAYSSKRAHTHRETHTRTLWKAAWLLVKGSLLKTGPGRECWSAAKQDSYKVEHGRPRHVCRDLKPLSPKLCLHFVQCGSWTVHRKAFS